MPCFRFVNRLPKDIGCDIGELEDAIGLTTPPVDIVLYAAEAPVRVGAWNVVADATAAGGARLRNPDAGVPKLLTPLAAPAHYFEMTFYARALTPYRLWIRGKADNNYWANDSVFVQFSGAVDYEGGSVNGIGSTQALTAYMEDRGGPLGWGWMDNQYQEGLGPTVQFEQSGMQTIRIQSREDGLSIDQIVLSPGNYLDASPGLYLNDNTILPK